MHAVRLRFMRVQTRTQAFTKKQQSDSNLNIVFEVHSNCLPAWKVLSYSTNIGGEGAHNQDKRKLKATALQCFRMS